MMIGKSCVSRIESCGISTSGDREEEVKRRSLRKGKWRKTKLVLFTEPKWNQIFKHLKYYLSIKYDENRNFTTRFINIEIISFFMEISFGKVLAEDESLILINLADKVGGKLETISVDIFFQEVLTWSGTEKSDPVDLCLPSSSHSHLSCLMVPGVHPDWWKQAGAVSPILLIPISSQLISRSHLYLTVLRCPRNKQKKKITIERFELWIIKF